MGGSLVELVFVSLEEQLIDVKTAALSRPSIDFRVLIGTADGFINSSFNSLIFGIPLSQGKLNLFLLSLSFSLSNLL